VAAIVVDEQSAIPGAGAACKRAAELVLQKRKVVVALVDDARMAELHERFLGQAGPTDVLSFPHGEIVVSADTACREARARGIPPLQELVLYVVHGALHLAGYDDRKPKQCRLMREAERRVLGELGYGDVFGAAEPAARPRTPPRTSARARKVAAKKKSMQRKRHPRS
jgi:probable rRNA maturation factor